MSDVFPTHQMKIYSAVTVALGYLVGSDQTNTQEHEVNLSDEPQPESVDQPPQPEMSESLSQPQQPVADSSATGEPAFVDGKFYSLDPRNVAVERTSLLIIWVCISIAILVGLGYLVLTSGIDLVFWIGCGVGLFLIVASGLFALLWPKIEHVKISYRVDPLGIEIHQGVFWRSQICVPIGRVQHADVGQGPLQRVFGVSTLTLYTAGTSHASVSIEGLDHALAVNVRDWIVHQRRGYDAV